MNPIFDFFLDPYIDRSPYLIVLEAVALFTGIASVIYAKKENILVYPTGLVATLITMYIFLVDQLLGDMMINLYYSIMSIYGWWNWARVNNDKKVVQISRTNGREKITGVGLFVLTVLITYSVYRIFGKQINLSNYIDMLTSGLFFTAMWYMANKKLENWTLWIIADIITVPLYAYRGWGCFPFNTLSLQFWQYRVISHGKRT